MISVINLHAGGTGEYIGRPSILGNPYILGVDGTRADCIDKYETYFLDKLENDPKFRKEFERLVDLARAGKLSIACWCAPQRCHGDVIKKYIEQRLNDEKFKSVFKKSNFL
jgi:hypothetical protein